MLKQHGIAAVSGIEEAYMQAALQHEQEQGNGDDGSAQDHDRAGGVKRPDEQRQAEPRQSRSTHAVDRYDEIQARENGGEAVDEDAQACGNHVAV